MKVIMKGLAGSRAYGLSGPDSDYDWRGIYVADTESVLSLHKPKETMESAVEDMVMHEVEKFIRLALAANPNIIEQLYLDEYETEEEEWLWVKAERGSFLSKRLRTTYGGYCMAQMKKLRTRTESGMVGFSPKTSKRTVKHARHLLRLFIQGQQLLATGHLDVKLDEWQKDFVMTQSMLPLEQLERVFEAQMLALDIIASKSKLPDEPSYGIANNLLLDIRGRNYHD